MAEYFLWDILAGSSSDSRWQFYGFVINRIFKKELFASQNVVLDKFTNTCLALWLLMEIYSMLEYVTKNHKAMHTILFKLEQLYSLLA